MLNRVSRGDPILADTFNSLVDVANSSQFYSNPDGGWVAGSRGLQNQYSFNDYPQWEAVEQGRNWTVDLQTGIPIDTWVQIGNNNVQAIPFKGEREYEGVSAEAGDYSGEWWLGVKQKVIDDPNNLSGDDVSALYQSFSDRSLSSYWSGLPEDDTKYDVVITRCRERLDEAVEDVDGERYGFWMKMYRLAKKRGSVDGHGCGGYNVSWYNIQPTIASASENMAYDTRTEKNPDDPQSFDLYICTPEVEVQEQALWQNDAGVDPVPDECNPRLQVHDIFNWAYDIEDGRQSGLQPIHRENKIATIEYQSNRHIQLYAHVWMKHYIGSSTTHQTLYDVNVLLADGTDITEYGWNSPPDSEVDYVYRIMKFADVDCGTGAVTQFFNGKYIVDASFIPCDLSGGGGGTPSCDTRDVRTDDVSLNHTSELSDSALQMFNFNDPQASDYARVDIGQQYRPQLHGDADYQTEVKFVARFQDASDPDEYSLKYVDLRQRQQFPGCFEPCFDDDDNLTALDNCVVQWERVFVDGGKKSVSPGQGSRIVYADVAHPRNLSSEVSYWYPTASDIAVNSMPESNWVWPAVNEGDARTLIPLYKTYDGKIRVDYRNVPALPVWRWAP